MAPRATYSLNVDFTLDQRFDQSGVAVAAALVDPDLLQQMTELPLLAEATVLSTERSGDRIRQSVRYRFEAELSSAVRRVIDPAKLTWVEMGEHDLTAGLSRFEIRPDHYSDLLQGRYTASVETSDDGRASTRIVKGMIKVKVVLVGARVENAIISSLRELAEAQQEIVEGWINSK